MFVCLFVCLCICRSTGVWLPAGLSLWCNPLSCYFLVPIFCWKAEGEVSPCFWLWRGLGRSRLRSSPRPWLWRKRAGHVLRARGLFWYMPFSSCLALARQGRFGAVPSNYGAYVGVLVGGCVTKRGVAYKRGARTPHVEDLDPLRTWAVSSTALRKHGQLWTQSPHRAL